MEDREPLVSIVIPVYNGANYMREAIDSALKQTYKNIEIIVVNDGSTDNTREIALSYGDKIRYFEKENGGVSTALNLAIENMKGEYFSWLSHDDIYEPNKIELEIDGLRRYNLLDNPMIVYCDRGYWYSPDNVREKASVPKEYREEGIYPGIKIFMFVGVFGCELLIPKNYFEKYGMFDTNFRYVQDSIKWFQMLQENEVLHVPGVLMWGRFHKGNRSNDDEYKPEALMSSKYYIDNITSKALSILGCSLYDFTCTWLTRNGFTYDNRQIFISKLLSMPEPNDIKEKIERFKNWLKQYGGKEIYLYCAGRRCHLLSLRFLLSGIEVAGISDTDETKWGQTINGYLCVPPKDVPKDALVIVTKKGPEDVVNMLKGKGYDKVVAYDDFMYDVFFLPMPKDKLIEYAKENGWV